MEFRDKTVTIGEGEFIIVPRGVEHLPNAKDEVCCFVCAGKYCLRACIVNYRTSEKDILETIDIIVLEGRKVHEALKRKL